MHVGVRIGELDGDELGPSSFKPPDEIRQDPTAFDTAFVPTASTGVELEVDRILAHANAIKEDFRARVMMLPLY